LEVEPCDEVDEGGDEEACEEAWARMWCWANAIHWRSKLLRPARMLRLRLLEDVGLIVAVPEADTDDADELDDDTDDDSTKW